MTKTALKSICACILASALPVCVPVCSWAGNGSYGVPPSPYGQVGNPFLAPVQVPTFPTQAPVAPVVPKPVAVVQIPKPAPVRVVAPKPAPVSAPVPAPAAVATVAPDDGYQVPATSKYAARINAARAAAGQMTTASAPPTPVSEPVSAPVPTPAPAPTTDPAADHVFVPGEHYSDASQAPRQYSLHRQWGLTPDKIQVDHTATGALLTLTDVPGSGKIDSGTTEKDTPTEDDGAEALPPAKTATP